jgi:selenocysteine-specific elongation factor
VNDPTTIPYILATAGHVDHGKSALVLALTGTDPDRLPEEKARGITIELGFAELRIPSPAGASAAATYQVGVVDVPGHEDFVKNMVAGVGSIDAALLVVAADDGWMPQTEEHLQILTYLGVRRGVVALSKIDLVADETAAVAAVRGKLRGTPLAEAPIVPTSAPSGRGIDALRAALAAVLARTEPQPDAGKPRLPVDRVFSLKGSGTVVTGTLTGGTLRRGQAVVVQPGGTATRVRSVQTHKQDVEVGRPGSRVALNLPDVAVSSGRASARGAAAGAGTVARGDVVTLSGVGSPVRTMDVLLERSGRATAPGVEAAPRPLKDDAIVQVHHASAAAPARVRLLEGRREIAPGERGLARLALEKPLLALAGDRFVVRDWPEQHTLAGGIVLDANPPPPARKGDPHRAAQQELLRARAAAAPLDAATLVATQLKRDGVATRSAVVCHCRFSSAEIDAAVAALARAGSLVVAAELLADAQWWSALRRRAGEAVDRQHREHPEKSGLPLTELRSSIAAGMAEGQTEIAATVADALLAELCRDGFERTTTGTLRRTSHRPSLPPRLQAAGEALRRQLAGRPFDPPSRKELAATDVAFQALKFLLASGEAVEVGPEVVLSADAYARAAAAIRAHIQSRGPATVSELKTALGSSRRVMVPLLEKLDRDGVTRREGDRRVLR